MIEDLVAHVIASVALICIGAILGYSRRGYTRKALENSYDRGFAAGRKEANTHEIERPAFGNPPTK